MCDTLYVEPKTYLDLLALYQSMRNMPSSQNLLFSASCSSLQNCRKGDESGLLKYFRGGIFCYFTVSLYVNHNVLHTYSSGKSNIARCEKTALLLNNLLQNIEYGSNGAFRNTVKSQSSNECAAVNNPMNLPPASRMAEAWACVDKNFPTASQASVNIEINGDL
ncbi:conserved hypothetical protein [Trichinella spiralis]|uniref:hypothetical protein n=1 Tax=Trichinella spiralis TaxID=6334 RepID=UPI0001EFD7D3|nr:conserved hypothetical protein [Trichinella spiralis]